MTHSTFSRRLEATDANQTGRHGGAFVKFPFNPKEVCILTVHFSSMELSDRRKAVAAELADRGLDGLLMFRQESMYYLTGYDTFGYVFFQCLYMGADGETMTLLTRTPDLRQARHTSVIEDIRLWHDAEGVNPAEDLRRILAEHGLGGKR